MLALDSSPTAIERLSSAAQAEGLPLQAQRADLSAGDLPGEHDTIVAIGLLMFFPRARALELLRALQVRVRPGGVAIVNVLLEGTTWLEPFEPGRRHLFAEGELERHFAGWTHLATVRHEFPAPGGALKRFATGTYVVWYPVIPRTEAHDLPRKLRAAAQRAGRGWLHATLAVGHPPLEPNERPGLTASGVFIINPPHTLAAGLKEALPLLVDVLGRGRGQGHAVETGDG